MKKIEQVYREILYNVIEKKNNRFTQLGLAKKLQISLSTVNFALKKLQKIGSIKIGKNRGAFLNRVYGFKVRDKVYDGLIKKLNGKKLGKSSIAVPAESSKEILDLLGKYKVEAKVINIYLQP